MIKPERTTATLKGARAETEAKAQDKQEAGTGQVPEQESIRNDSYHSSSHKCSGTARLAPVDARRDTRGQVYHYLGATAGQSHE
jgi:hypothetical protein